MSTTNKVSGLVKIWLGAVLLVASTTALAVPSFGRQTGRPCSGCHTVFPELTPYGREFKLGGYVAGDKLKAAKGLLRAPLSVSGVLSQTSTSKTSDAAPEDFPQDRQVIVQNFSIYYAGRIAGNVGALAQYKYDAAEFHWATEMVDIRYGNETTLGQDRQLNYGITVNNSPTVSDIYNSTPVWEFPHLESDAAVMPNAGTIVDMALASQVGGIGAYLRWNELVYAEFDMYRKGTGLFHPLTSGVDLSSVLDGNAPYWRVALQHESQPHNFEVGTFGLNAKIFPDATQPSGASDRFQDIAWDAQYQYLEGPHSLSVHAMYIHEKQDWNASYPQGMAADPSSTLNTTRADVHYFFQHRVGGGVQYFSTTGGADAVRYNTGEPIMGSSSGKPDTSGLVGRLNFLPIPNIQLGVQYTAYDRFNGGRTNYSGSGRNASDNNSLYIYAWALY